MDKKEYIIKQLGRTKNKKYEAYVVTRIIHFINDLNIKFVTQQYVTRPGEGRALTDLFFPQFSIHIEIDEGQHFSHDNIKADKIREADIINATGHEILRVDATKTIEDINYQIDSIVTKIKNRRDDASFIPWDFQAEFDPETYIKRGYIDVRDNVAFKTIKDACNCFGNNYIGYQKASANHQYRDDVILWFPKLFPNGEWNNQISEDEETITERNEDNIEAETHVLTHVSNPKKYKHKRIVFAKVRGNLGDILYRFRGEYELDKKDSNIEVGLVWRRTKTRVATFGKKNANKKN